jgi:hypothetical protein
MIIIIKNGQIQAIHSNEVTEIVIEQDDVVSIQEAASMSLLDKRTYMSIMLEVRAIKDKSK